MSFGMGDAHRAAVLLACHLHAFGHHLDDFLLGFVLVRGDGLDVVLVHKVVRHAACSFTSVLFLWMVRAFFAACKPIYGVQNFRSSSRSARGFSSAIQCPQSGIPMIVTFFATSASIAFAIGR